MFRVSQHPSSGVLKSVTAASGTGHNTGTATSLQRGLIGTAKQILQLVHMLSCMNKFQNFTHLKICFDIVLPSVSSSSRHYFIFDFATNSVTKEVLKTCQTVL